MAFLPNYLLHKKKHKGRPIVKLLSLFFDLADMFDHDYSWLFQILVSGAVKRFENGWCGCRCGIKFLFTIFLTIFLIIFLFVPDPRKWSREEVREWLMWMSLRHKVPIDPARFQMNGKALCLMSLQMFAFRVPIGGKLLYKDFQLRLTSAFHRELYETKS